MLKLIVWLDDSKIVARFQKICGVELAKPVDSQMRPAINKGVKLFALCNMDENLLLRQLQSFYNFNQTINKFPYRNENQAFQNFTDQHYGQNSKRQNNDCFKPTCNISDSNCIENVIDHRIKSVVHQQSKHLDNYKQRSSNGMLGYISILFNIIYERFYFSNNNKLCMYLFSSLKCPQDVVIRYPVLYFLAHFGAFLGNEDFYITVLPFFFWSVDSVVLRQTVLVWWPVMYLGQVTKDYLRWPRPASPPVVRLESKYLAEFSMPSTHAMGGTIIPLMFSSLLIDKYQLGVLPFVIVTSLWCFLTSTSRLYLGVHTLLDVICGNMYALFIYLILYRWTSTINWYLQTNVFAPVLIIPGSLALCMATYYAMFKAGTASEDCINTTAIVAGFLLGCWLNFQFGLTQITKSDLPLTISAPTLTWSWNSIKQAFMGLVLILLIKNAVMHFTIPMFFALFRVHQQSQKHSGVQIGSKYCSYFASGLAVTFICPLVFIIFGCSRQTFRSEVL